MMKKNDELFGDMLPAVRQLFRRACDYARTQLQREEGRKKYELMAMLMGLDSAYRAAVTDFINMPEILSIDATFYTGRAGDTIFIDVRSRNGVADLLIDILDADGMTVETGVAIYDATIGVWVYTATWPDPGAGKVVVAELYDFAGRSVAMKKLVK